MYSPEETLSVVSSWMITNLPSLVWIPSETAITILDLVLASSLILFKNGKVTDISVGALSESGFVSYLQTNGFIK